MLILLIYFRLEDGTKILNNNSLSFGDGKTFPNDLNVIKNMEIQNIDTEIRQALTEFLQSDVRYFYSFFIKTQVTVKIIKSDYSF